MALPRLNNDQPIYELTIPSTRKKAKFRPFLVKEQKGLLIALESRDPKQILTSILQSIDTCIQDVDSSKLSTFDIDYIFTQIRGKSVGEKTKLSGKCTECEHEKEIELNLSEIDMSFEAMDNIIPLTEDIKVKMKYPTYIDMMEHSDILFAENLNTTDQLYASIKMCLESVQTKEENIDLKEESTEEIDGFMNSLNNDQLTEITKYVTNMPSLSHTVTWKCEKCEHENTLNLNGIQDFF